MDTSGFAAAEMPARDVGVRRETVRRLVTVRHDPVISSVYLDIDGAHRPVRAMYEVAFEQLAHHLRRRARARDDALVARSVEGDIGRMRAWLEEGIDRAVTRGLAMFSCHQQGYFEAIELPVAVRDEAGIGPTPHVRQLLEVLDEPEPFALALVDGTHLRIFRAHGPQMEEHPTFVTTQERAVDTSVELGSWERHREEVARAHLRRAASAVDDALRSLAVRQLVIGGPDEPLGELERHLHATTREKIIGRLGVRVTAPTDEIAAAAHSVAADAERQREVALVEEARQRTAGGHGGAVGLDATLAALAEGRVKILLVSDGFAAPGALCPACGHVGVDLRLCPVCRSSNVELEDVVEVAVQHAVAQGAEVEFCRGTELDRFGSIAVIERY